ncbi:MAG: hypothetical protein AAF705_19405 [Bacteroidota bacterium]
MRSNRKWIWILSFQVTIIGACTTFVAKEVETPVITAIYPSSDTLPENLLRMYIHFSKSMKTLGNLEKIKLVDEEGQEVFGAIFNNAYELWDKEQKQLTLLFDPSRVKTGLSAHNEKGRSLRVGKNYKLLVGQLEDVEGKQLRAVYTKSFVVSQEDRLSPNTALWELKIPQANSLAPLIVRFPDMLDRLSLLQRLQLINESHQPIAGQVEILQRETEWQLMPSEKWVAGNYHLYIHGRLEDPSGNNLNGLFDHKVGSLKNKQEGVIETISITIN